MRRKIKIALIWLGCLIAALILIPPIEYWLVKQPSCFAFVGMKPSTVSKDIRALLPVEARAARQKAIAQGVIQPPKPPYVIVTRVKEFGDGTAVNIIVAQAGDSSLTVWGKEWLWRIDEVNQVFDTAKNVPSSDFTAQPVRLLRKPKLSRLVQKRCLFNEPMMAFLPKARFSIFPPRPIYYDGGYRLIEVNDGTRSGYFDQANRPVGITGAIGQQLVLNAIGFNYPPYRDRETEN